MTQPVPTIDVRRVASEIVCNVFDTMLALQLTPSPAGASALPRAELVTGSIGIAGESVTGAVYLHLPDSLARQATTAMLGIRPEEIEGEHMVNDVVGELCNMVGGGLKSSLCDAGAPCAVSTPAIIRGSAYEIEAVPDVRKELLAFQCQAESLLLEVHVKFQ